jgi:hypothetical protein
MIKLEELINELDLEVLSEGVSLDREVLSGCCCDLLSWVMAHGKRNAICLHHRSQQLGLYAHQCSFAP